MGLSSEVVAKACERVFARLCDVGQSVPQGTPAAGFLAGAARRVDEARCALPSARDADDLGDVLRLLGEASTLLADVARLTEQEVDGLERVSVIVDGLCVTLELDQRDAARAEGQRGSD